MTWPENVKICFAVLRQGGHRGYLVGGCVRDLTMGRTPGDWDMTTDARPEEVMSLFPRTVPTGLKHGTVTVLLPGGSVEVTTFRRESGYSDGRHPDQVCFVDSLEEDLARRDFTMNAMALDEDGALTDPFDGRGDLKRGLIRSVGAAERRFREDGLRMFRAVRFAGQLGFRLDGEVERGLRRCWDLAAQVSAERISAEVEKLLCSPGPEWAGMLFEAGLMARFVPNTLIKSERLNRVPARPLERWAGLCALLETEPEPFLRRLKTQRKLWEACAAGWEAWNQGLSRNGEGWRRLLSQAGEDGARAAAAMGDCAWGGGHLAALEEVLAEGGCWSVRDLALTGKELAALGYQGPEIGRVQRALLSAVLREPEKNSREGLLELLKEERKK